MKFTPTALPEVILVEPRVFTDSRGFFMETYNRRVFSEAGIPAEFVQDNHSLSSRDVLRGLHYGLQQPQGKLVRVVRGEIFDVAVDMRAASPRRGQWVGVRLSAQNRRQLWVPPGFAHGFLCLAEQTEVAYKCTEFYVPADERCLRWNDADLAIGWPLDGRTPVLSEKDQLGGSLAQAEFCS